MGRAVRSTDEVCTELICGDLAYWERAAASFQSSYSLMWGPACLNRIDAADAADAADGANATGLGLHGEAGRLRPLLSACGPPRTNSLDGCVKQTAHWAGLQLLKSPPCPCEDYYNGLPHVGQLDGGRARFLP